MGDEKVIALLLMQQIAVLFLIMGLGFLIVKLGIVKTEDSRVLSMVTIYLVLPCVTIHAFQIEYSTKIRNGFLLAVAVAIMIHVVLFVVCGILRKLLKMDEVETASLIYSNAGNLILPLVTSILGEEWVIYASGFMCVQTIIVWTHGQSLMQGQRQVNLKKIVQNINLIAILTGLVFFLCNIHLPKIIDSMTSSLAGMIGPISMVMIGMLLAGVDWKLVFGKRRIYGIVFLKMIVVPAGNHYPVPETGGTADPDGECKHDPADQPAGGDCADGGNDHTDGTTLQKRCCVCKLDQCIYHPGVHRNDATDGDAVYDIISVSEPEACLHGYGERRMAIMNEVHDIMIFADPLFCFYFIFFTAVDSISLIRFSWFTSEAPGS